MSSVQPKRTLEEETSKAVHDVWAVVNPAGELDNTATAFLDGVGIALRLKADPATLRNQILATLAVYDEELVAGAGVAHNYLQRRWNGPGRPAA